MGSVTVFAALTLTALLGLQAAPVTEFFGPPEIIEGDRNVVYPNPIPVKKVEEMERFHRTYKNGTVEFKMALNNGHVQYQRISTKYVDGDKIQVFEGYISEQYKDGRYGTRYYAADENGYRSSPVIVENNPPKLPSSGPYALNKPSDSENELPPLVNEDIPTNEKTDEDNSVEFEKDLEEIKFPNLNPGSNIVQEDSNSTTASDILKQEDNEEILEKNNGEEVVKQVEEQLTNLNQGSEIVKEDTISTTEPEILKKEDSEEILEKNNGEEIVKQEEDISEKNKGDEIPPSVTEDVQARTKTVEENLIEIEKDLEEEQLNNLNLGSDIVKEDSISTTESEILKQEDNEEKKTEEELSVQQNSDLPASTEVSPISPNSEDSFEKVNDQVESSTLPASSIDVATESEILKKEDNEEILEKKNDDGLSVQQNSDLPASSPISEDKEVDSSTLPPSSIDVSTEISTEQPSTEAITEADNLEISSELPKFEEQSIGRNLHSSSSSEILSEGEEDIKEITNGEPIVPIGDIIPNLEVSTEASIDELPETTTDALLNEDVVTSTELPASFNIEGQKFEAKTPEFNEIKTEDDVSRYLEHKTGAISEYISPVFNKNDENSEKTLEQDPSTEGNEDQESRTEIPEINEIKTDGDTSNVSKYPIEISEDVSNNNSNEDTSTEQPAFINKEDHEITTDISEINGEVSTVSDDVSETTTEALLNDEYKSTELPASDEDQESSTIQSEITTEIPLEDHAIKTDEELDSKQSRSLDVSTDLPVPEKNSTTVAKSSKEGENTTNKIDITTEQPKSKEEEDIIATTVSEEGTTTEAEIISTTEENDIKSISTEQPSKSSEEDLSEKSTEHPKESSEENDTTGKVSEITTEEPGFFHKLLHLEMWT